MPVDSKHRLYKQFKGRWDLCSDVVEGAWAVKKNAGIYLQRIDAAGEDKESSLIRNRIYQSLASFTAVAGATVYGFVGLAFNRQPTITTTESEKMLPLMTNADGRGSGLEQLAKRALGNVLALGRIGFMVDYPDKSECESRPIITMVDPRNIVNWRVNDHLGCASLVMTVIREELEDVSESDFFVADTRYQYRALTINEDGNYTVGVYREGAKEPDVAVEPTDGFGDKFKEIQFFYAGAENNDPDPDAPMIEDIAHLCIGAFQNSADAELSSFEMRPTIVVKSKGVGGGFDGVTVNMGGVTNIREGESVEMIQTIQNDIASKLRQEKIEDMIKISAQIIATNATQRTATESRSDEIQRTSRLSLACDNVSDALTKALESCARFAGVDTGKDPVKFQINTNFSTNNMTAPERQQLMAEWIGGAVSDRDYHRSLAGDGVITETFEEWQLSREIKNVG